MTALTYEYKVTSLKVRTEGEYSNTVVQTYWTLTGTDQANNSGTFSGATPFTYDPEDSSGPFVPFNELTESDVITWISGVVANNAGYKTHIDGVITKQITDKLSPITEPSLPWAANTAPIAPPGTV